MAGHKNIPYSRQLIDEEDIEAVNAVLRSDFVTQGKTVGQFEEALCEVTGARHAIAVSSGTAGLHLLCLAIKNESVQPLKGLTSPITFAASANCMVHCGFDVVFGDVYPESGLLDAATCSEADLGIPVSFAGSVPDLPLLQKKFKHVFEDAAHSMGAHYLSDGQVYQSASCQHSDAAILSFHPVKHICTGEGGAVLTNDANLAQAVRLLSSHSIIRPQEGPDWFYDQIGLGLNYRMTEIQAALGLSQLKKLPFFLERRRQLAKRYCELLNADPFSKQIKTEAYQANSAYHLFIIHFENSELRDQAHTFLKTRNIFTQVHYKPVYQHTYYREHWGDIALEGAEQFFQGCLSIPIYPALSDDDQDYVIESLALFLKNQ